MNNNEWTHGYVTEVDYTYGHYREMAPAMIEFSLLCAGIAPPESRNYHFCELGFGQGAGLNLFAAANPQAQFYGTDFNPAQAVGAQRLAQRAGLSNVHLFDDSFEAMRLRADLPQFDYIGLHGIYSWIAPENRRQIVQFIDEKLKPGGAVYISYNTMPGWAPMVPIQGLMNQYVDMQTSPGQPLAQRIKAAMTFIDKMAELPQGYLKSLPTLTDQVKKLAQQNPNYLAHEYFNRDWHPLFFKDVAAELNEAKLTFSASADVSNLVDALNLAPECNVIFEGITDPIFRQEIRDFLTGARFRRDIFVRGPRNVGQQVQVERLKASRIALIRPKKSCKLEVSSGLGTSNLKPEIYNPLLDALESGPKTIAELAALPALANLPFNRLLQAVLVLVGVNYAQPCVAESTSPKLDSCLQMNTLMAAYAREPGTPEIHYLASPELGCGIGQGRFGRLFVDWINSGGDATAEACAESVWQCLAKIGQLIIKDGQQLNTTAENLDELRTQANTWLVEQLPILRQLGVVK